MGSSAKTMAGRPTRARAIATRCRCPTEIWVGRACSRSAEADRGQRLGRVFPPLPDRHAGVEQPVGDVVQQGGVLGEEELLEHEPHPARP